jgi:hypothetical protein
MRRILDVSSVKIVDPIVAAPDLSRLEPDWRERSREVPARILRCRGACAKRLTSKQVLGTFASPARTTSTSFLGFPNRVAGFPKLMS